LSLLQLIARGHCRFSTVKECCFALCKESTPVLQSLQVLQSRKACNSGGDCVAACKPVISDFAREFAAIARLQLRNLRKIRRLLQFWVLTTIQLQLQSSP
jgi:hypothetical protein